MPIFEYTCDDCGIKFEKLLRRNIDANALECPACGQKHLTTQYSTFAAHASGSKGAAETSGDCGAGMCGTNMCGGGMCGMNFN